MSTLKYIGKFLGFVLFLSCISPDDLEFPEETESVVTSPSVAITSLLNTINLGGNIGFEFYFPIQLGFNSGISISISDLNGLKETAASQSNGFHINQIEFPFLVDADGLIKSIENEQEFIQLLETSGIPTLKDDLGETIFQCFDFVYPIQMLDSDSITIELSTPSGYKQFMADQPESYQPDFIFPLGMDVFAADTAKQVKSYFELYEIINACEGCPDLGFRIEEIEDNRFKFVADFDGLEDAHSYDWFIDGRFIETDGNGVGGDNQLTETFEPGVYEICMYTETPDCALGTSFCKVLTVEREEPACPEPFFEIDEEFEFGTYKFYAEFPGMNELTYEWKVYEHDSLLHHETEGPDGDNTLFFQFHPGEFEVCIYVVTDECPEGIWYCDEVIVEQDCPELFFEYEILQDSSVYTFYAEFPGMNEITYRWKIYYKDELLHSKLEEPGGNNILEYAFGESGEYEICLYTTTDRCPFGTEYCEFIQIE